MNNQIKQKSRMNQKEGVNMLVNDAHKKIIEERFKVVREAAKNREEELFSVLNTCTEDEAICLKYLYAFMPEQDLANHDGELFLKFVKQALKYVKSYLGEIN